ncbi:Hsp20/alpha crystallin family protein [Streptomyces sp. NPDC051207]|uniref:Hsp20/alpha crystallin family protein n=1 Tax=Streptomyces sp. NPDC051207 TaxID=3154641 RepID=UPI003424E75D
MVEVLDTELTVRGEVKDKERGGILRRQKRRVGQFAFRMGLPDDADTEKISASLAYGVLTVHVPRAHQAKRHRIPITG